MRRFAAVLLLAAVAATEPATGHPFRAHFERRGRLAAALGRDYALVLGQPLTDVLQPRQEGHLLYLTGVDEPGAALLLAGVEAAPLALAPGQRVREALLLTDLGPRYDRFLGTRWKPGADAARELAVGAAVAAPRSLGDLLADVLPRDCALRVPAYAGPDGGLVRERRRLLVETLAARRPDVRIVDLHGQLSAMRAVKDERELAAMTRAIDITLDAFRDALPGIRPGGSEAALDGALLAGVRGRGARPAYPFVVASGENACTPHYFRNEDPLRHGDLLIIDAGAAVERYAADVTRTFPVSGRFTPRQREVYEAVLRAQRAALRAVRPGTTLLAVHAAARAALEDAGLETYMLHGTSHFIGLDVHDPGTGRLETGMTITVEPGVYIADERIAVRIEDVVVVTENGARVLSDAFPKEPDAIERLLRDRE